MFAVVVTFNIKPEYMEEFLPQMKKNAQTSFAKEPGCRRFDILTDPSRANEVFLYELYDDKEAFEQHLQSSHFIAFDQIATEMVATKEIKTYSKCHSPNPGSV